MIGLTSARAMAIGMRRITYGLCLGLALTTAARANVVSTFDSGIEDWSVRQLHQPDDGRLCGVVRPAAEL